MSSTHGADATERMKVNLQDQLQRLLMQLEDLEELRAELEDDEYDEVRRDTLEQMEEVNAQLKKLMNNDISLVTELGAMKLAIEAAIKQAFKTPEVIRMFAQKEPGQLRLRLAQLQESHKLGRLADEAFKRQSIEIVVALKKLGESLTPEEQAILDASGDAARLFEEAVEGEGVGEGAVMSLAGKGLRGAKAAGDAVRVVARLKAGAAGGGGGRG